MQSFAIEEVFISLENQLTTTSSTQDDSLPMRCPLPQHIQSGHSGQAPPPLEARPGPHRPVSGAEPPTHPSLTQEGRLRVGSSVSPSGDGPGRRPPLPGLSREEQGRSEEQQKAGHQHLFHLQEEEEGLGCGKHNGRRGLGEVSGALSPTSGRPTHPPAPCLSPSRRAAGT